MKGIPMAEEEIKPEPQVASPQKGGPEEAGFERTANGVASVPRAAAPGTQALIGRKVRRNRYEPIKAALIEEGEFLNSMDEEIAEACKHLIAMKKKHGWQVMKKMKAVVGIALTIQFDGADESDFSIKTAFKKTLPTRPPHVTKAIQGPGDDDDDMILVRPTGSTADDPRQQVLCTKDGRAVNPETGEITQ